MSDNSMDASLPGEQTGVDGEQTRSSVTSQNAGGAEARASSSDHVELGVSQPEDANEANEGGDDGFDDPDSENENDNDNDAEPAAEQANDNANAGEDFTVRVDRSSMNAGNSEQVNIVSAADPDADNDGASDAEAEEVRGSQTQPEPAQAEAQENEDNEDDGFDEASEGDDEAEEAASPAIIQNDALVAPPSVQEESKRPTTASRTRSNSRPPTARMKEEEPSTGGLNANEIKLRFDIPELPDLELQQLSHLVREVRESELPDRVQQLRREVENETIMVGSLNMDDLQKEEARMERERIEAVQKEMLRHQRRQADIAAREADARRRLHAEKSTSVLESREEAMSLIARSMISTKDQQQAFRKAEDRLKAALESEKASVKVEFGDLVADNRAIKGRRYTANWDDAPRLVCIKNMVMRAVKNKLPSGRYVMLCTIFDRLGGVPLRWSKLKDFGYFHRTQQPVRHGGRYYDVEMSFKQRTNKLFLACPAKTATNPSNVFVFELFQVRNSTSNKTDRVVAWGAFPMANPTFDVVKGHFKVPLLRGERDPLIEKFSEIEDLMATNIDNWLCNLYFSVEHWPRYMNGQREYEVELKYTQQLLQLPEFDPVQNPTLAAAAAAADDGEESEEDMGEGGWKQIWTRTEGLNSMNKISIESDYQDNSAAMNIQKQFEGSSKAFDDLLNHDISGQRMGGAMSTFNSHGDQSSDAAAALSGLANTGQKIGAIKASVKTIEKPGSMNVFEDLDLQQEVEAERVKAERDQLRLEEARRQTRLLQKYRFAIVDPSTDVPQSDMAEKLRYIRGELRNEMGLHRIGTFDFWSFMLILFLMLWLRIYIHYLGEYLFLEGSDIAIQQTDIRFYTVYFRYSAATVDLATELVTSFIGVVANQAIFLILILLSYVFQRLVRVYPEMCSRMMLAFGMATVADPLLILLFDICDANWSGDHFKLYNYYERHEANGIPGLLLAVAIGIFAIAISAFLFYEYLLLIHANGRMLDLHRRLHGDEGSFFMPQDFEVSVRTLRWIVTKARRAGSGMLGAKNKIAVTSYTVRDHADASFEATTIHLAIFKQPLSGEEQLFRHFVRQPDGAIVEIFDNVEAAGIDEYKKLEQRLDAKHNPTGPQLSSSSEMVPNNISKSRPLAPKRESLSALAARRKSLNL